MGYRCSAVKTQTENKGKILIKERKMSIKTFSVIILLAFSLVIGLDFLFFCPEDCASFFIMITLPLMFAPFILLRKDIFVVYENGFDAPLEVYRLLLGEEKFIYFDSITKIEPYYSQTPNTVDEILGYVITTSDGREIKLISPIIGDAKMYRDSLKKALGTKWNKIYDPKPHGLLKNLDTEKIKKCVSKNRKMDIIGYFLLISSSIMVVSTPFILDYLFLSVILISIAFLGGPVGMMIVINNQICRKKYELLVRFYPDIIRDLDVKMERRQTFLENAKKFTKKDWDKLERKLSFNPFLIATLGMALIVVSIGVIDLESIAIYSSMIMAAGLLLLIFSIIILILIYNIISFIKEVIKEEYKSENKILPYDFKIPKWAFGWVIPFRDPSEISEKAWKNMAKSADLMTEKKIAVYVVLSIGAFLFSLLISDYLTNTIKMFSISFLFFFIISFSPIIYGLKRLKYRIMLNYVLDYEEETGKKIIPKNYRKEIEKGLQKVQKMSSFK